jgi:hypothetical protein
MKSKAPDLETLSWDHRVLDLRAYWIAFENSTPLPTFSLINKTGEPRAKMRYLGEDKQAHIINSPLSPAFYEEAHGVDRLIVRDIRRRAACDL